MQKNIKIKSWTQFSDITISDIQPKILLENKLIVPSSYFLSKPLPEWLKEVQNAIEVMYMDRRQIENAAQIAGIFNQATLICLALSHFKYAREIAYSQIHLFTNASKKYDANHLLKYIFQPWLFLVQIDRAEENIYDAFQKINALNFFHPWKIIQRENESLIKLIYFSLNQDPLLNKKIIMQSLIEKTKLYLKSRQYTELIDFIESNKLQFSNAQEVIIREAQAIAYANLGKPSQAMSVLQADRMHENAGKDPVLMLRVLEMQLSLGINKTLVTNLNSFYEAIFNSMNLAKFTIGHLPFILHAVRVMQTAGLIEKAVKLSYFCLDMAVKMQDEILTADSLISLYGLANDAASRKIIEDLMISHYFNTQYVAARQKMLACFAELKYVEIKHYDDEIRPIFEDLLAFNFH
jgi:hypothetical protein